MYSFYMDSVQLPVTPSDLSLKITNQNKTMNLINDGEINILKSPGLSEISFKATIPQVKYPFAVYKDGYKEASYFLDKFEKLKNSKKPFQFIVSRVSPAGKLLFDTNMTVSLEEYTIDEDAENGLDLEVSIELKQFKAYGTKKAVIIQPPVTQAAVKPLAQTVQVETQRETTKEAPKTHTVVKGDTLWAICKKELGSGTKYPEIAKLNGISNPNLIYQGQVIKLG